MQRHLRASTLSKSILGLIVKRMNGVEMKDAMKHVNRIHEFVYSLHEQGTLNLYLPGTSTELQKDQFSAAKKGGISSDFLRAVMHPYVLEDNSKAVSNFYWEHLSSQTICSIDERIFIAASTRLPSGHMSPNRKRPRNSNSTDGGQVHPSKRRNSGGMLINAASSSLLSSMATGSSNQEGGPVPGAHVSSSPKPLMYRNGQHFSLPSLPVSVMHDNWLHSVVSNRLTAPSGRVISFFMAFTNGEDILKKKQSLTMHLIKKYMLETLKAGGLTMKQEKDSTSSSSLPSDMSLSSSSPSLLSVLAPPKVVASPKSLQIETSCHQAVQLFWATMESVLLTQDAVLGKMNMQGKMARIGQLLKSEAFHRALLACAVEIVFVGNKIYHHLFPQSLKTFEVKPLVMFSVIDSFIGARPDLPNAFKNHLKWCEDCVVSDIAWQNAGPKQELFGVMNACLKLLPTGLLSGGGGKGSGSSSGSSSSSSSSSSSTKPKLPKLLVDFLNKVQALANKRILQLATELGLETDTAVLDHIWTVFVSVLSTTYWLFQERHIDHIIVCCVYGVCKGHGKSILFHRIINAHQKITQQIKSSNADLLMLYQAGRCDLRAEINSECASDASGTLKSRPSGWTRVTTSIIGFYNHVFLKQTKEIITNLVGNSETATVVISFSKR